MKRSKFVIGMLAIVGMVLAVYFALKSDNALLTHPKGIIAHSELALIIKNYLLMLIVVIPTLILLFWVAWRYRAKNPKAKYEPEHSHGALKEVILWMIPSAVIAVMAVILWKDAHGLDPYKPIVSDVEPITVQVVALDWKWLFIYPEQGIAAVNYFQFPADTPIHLELSADGSPMNSFWLPQLSGQIYAMSGMTTQLHIMADAPGEYTGRAAEINGHGFADMIFVAKSTSPSDFESWVARVKKSSLHLSNRTYDELVKPSNNNPIMLYSHVEDDLFNRIVMKHMHPAH